VLSPVGVETAVTSARVGGIATVNEVIEKELLTFPAESVTVTVQSEIVPSARVLNVMVLLAAEAEVFELLQLPP
jgi:hypothetical protein